MDGEQTRTKPKFPLGNIYITPAALRSCAEAKVSPYVYIFRHAQEDWGELDEEDIKENEFSLEHGFRVLSAYTLPTGQRMFCITEADRSSTTLLNVEDY